MITRSKRLRIANFVANLLQMAGHIRKTQKIFEVTLTDDQYLQVNTIMCMCVLVSLALCLTFTIQSYIEKEMRDVARKDLIRFEKLAKEAVQAADAKDMFISSLSHEIRNPLNTINGGVQYLLEAAVGKEASQTQVLQNIGLSSRVLLNLVNNMLDAAKLRSDKMEIACVESNFENVLKSVIAMNDEALKKKNIESQIEIDQNLLEILWLDPSRLVQILMNLLSNAVKFTSLKGKINIHIQWCSPEESRKNLIQPIQDYLHGRFENNVPGNEAGLEAATEEDYKAADEDCSLQIIQPFNFPKPENFLIKKRNSQSPTSPQKSSHIMIQKVPMQPAYKESDKGFLKVQVSDSGCGIPFEKISKLFTMFTQAHASIESMTGGTGLGLWICKQLCQRMEGEIKVYSKLNTGTTFVFYIPIHNENVKSPVSLGNMPAAAPVVEKKTRALVVDDYSFNRTLHKLLLEREGVHVTLACDGKEAVDRYREMENGYFDFIFMDVQMPVMDGFSAARAIRGLELEEDRKKTDIYFISGEYYDVNEIIKEFRVKGAGGNMDEVGIRCLRKPIEVEMVKKIVAKFVGSSSGSLSAGSAGGSLSLS